MAQLLDKLGCRSVLAALGLDGTAGCCSRLLAGLADVCTDLGLQGTAEHSQSLMCYLAHKEQVWKLTQVQMQVGQAWCSLWAGTAAQSWT